MRYRVPSADRNPQQDLRRDRQPGSFTVSAGPPENSSGGPPRFAPTFTLSSAVKDLLIRLLLP